MDWKEPSHADSGPVEPVSDVAVPTGSGGTVAGQVSLSAESAADGLTGDQGGLAPLPDGDSEADPDLPGRPSAQVDAHRIDAHRDWRSMFRAVSAKRARVHLAGARPARPQQTRPQQTSQPITSRPIINPRLTADPRLRIWSIRTGIAAGLYICFMLWLGWRVGLTIAALFGVADIVFRSKTTAVIPPSIRVTSAQRSTRRRLKVLQPAGYLALNACVVPGTQSVIDHIVVGPAGVFVLDSERWDRRLAVRTIGGMLYYGPVSQKDRLEHSRWEAHQAAALIGAELGRSVKVHPAMIIYGPGIPWKVTRLAGVDVLDGGRIGTYFRHQSKSTHRHHLDAGQIAAIFAAAAQALPPMALP